MNNPVPQAAPSSSPSLGPARGADIVCLSHLRWHFVFQRPQHLLTRFARTGRVFFVEEPVCDATTSHLTETLDPSGVVVVVPHVRPGLDAAHTSRELRSLVDGLLNQHHVRHFVLWYYTPMARDFTAHLEPAAIVYDCMDELSGFVGAPAGLLDAERDLLRQADVVLTGGQSLYEAKRHLHHNVHAVPSSVDAAHFARARGVAIEPDDQSSIPHPRIGFFGVIDERLDTALLAAAAALRPDWHFVLLGPVVKIDPAHLPQLANIHYLGPKPYSALPDYIAGWAVAILPFARNDATRFISPTKTPEYLAAGKPVVSTSIRDVVRPYGELGLARIADTPAAFVEAIAEALRVDRASFTMQADRFLQHMSWDMTFARTAGLVAGALADRSAMRSVTGSPVSASPSFALTRAVLD